MIEGIDISHWNGTYTNKGNVAFGFIRTSNGTTEDREFRNNKDEFLKIEIPGFYHYYRTNHTEHPPEEQADLFLSLTAGEPFQMLGVDYEISDYDDNVINTETAIELYGFCLFVQQEIPDTEIGLYCNIYNWRDVLLPLQGRDTKYGVIDWSIVFVWLPRYHGEPFADSITEISGIPVGINVDINQWTSSGDGEEYGVESERIDLNAYDGTVEEMKEWLKIGPTDCCEDLLAQVNINSLGIAELAKRLAILEQGQLELVENGLGYEDKFKEMDALEIEEQLGGLQWGVEKLREMAELHAINNLDDFATVESEINRLDHRIDGLEGGHNHPRFFKWLGWMR